eukprot:487461-Prymnesium_polylepis.1
MRAKVRGRDESTTQAEASGARRTCVSMVCFIARQAACSVCDDTSPALALSRRLRTHASQFGWARLIVRMAWIETGTRAQGDKAAPQQLRRWREAAEGTKHPLDVSCPLALRHVALVVPPHREEVLRFGTELERGELLVLVQERIRDHARD